MEAWIQLRLAGKWVTVKALLDDGSDVLVIDKNFLLRAAPGTELVEEGVVSWALGAEKISVPSYGEQRKMWKATDSWGTTKLSTDNFLVADVTEGYQVILGMPWHERGVSIDYRTKTWLHPLDPTTLQDLTLVTGRKQLQRAAREARCAVVVTSHPVAPSLHPTGAPPEDPDSPPVQFRDVVPEEYWAYEKIFDTALAGVLAPHRRWDHAIELEGDQMPPWGPIYSLAEKELEALRTYLEGALKKGWIRPSTSPAGAPILFVPKKGGKLRLCVDYRALNKITKKNRAPLPLIHEILDRLSSAKVFTKIDLKDAYYRLRIRDGDEWKTAFRTKYGHFEYMVLPMGLSNAPATFQSYINQALTGLVDVTCIVYLDDILIYTKDEESHAAAVKEVLQRLEDWGLYANPEKCAFHTQTIDFLGFIISPDGVSMEPARVEAIQEWPVPKNVHDLQVFLGFTGFYRRFIFKYSAVAAPLTDKLKKGAGGFPFTDSDVQAFKDLCRKFAEAPVLRHFDPALPIRLETDASDFAIGAVISQLEDGQWRPVAYLSQKLKGPELRYDTPEAELYAIVQSFKMWRRYLAYCQSPVEVLTDHLNHKYLLSKPQLSARQSRWLQDIVEFDFVIRHVPGARNPADGLSRRPDHRGTAEETTQARMEHLSEFTSRFEDPRVAAVVTRRQLARSQARDAEALEPAEGTQEQEASPSPVEELLPSLVDQVRVAQGTDPFVKMGKWRTVARRSRTGASPLSEDPDGLLRYRGRVYVPSDSPLQLEILQAYHDDPSGGHLGVRKTVARISKAFFWDKMRRSIEEYVPTCLVCQRTKARRHLPYGLLAPLPIPTRPFQEITVDLITGLPPSESLGGKRYNAILVVVCRFSKYALYIPTTKNLTADGLATLLFYHVFRHFGLPGGIVSDRGSLFTSHFWRTLCHLMGVKRRLSTAWHPQTDGQTERQNQDVENYLRAYCAYEQDDWATDRLLMAEHVYNSSVHSSTGKAPAEIVLGFLPRGPHDPPMDELKNRAVAAAQRAAEIRKTHEAVAQVLARSQAYQKKHYDRKRAEMQFKVGDYVMLSAKNIKQKRPSKKISDKYLGPFKVIAVVGSAGQAYRLELPPHYRIHDVFPVSLLEPWKQRPGEAPVAEQVLIEADENEEWYEVEAVLAHRGGGWRRQYLVKWAGHSDEENSWVKKKDMTQEAIRPYEEKLQAPPVLVIGEAVENSDAFERTGEPLGAQNPPEAPH